MKQLLNKDEYVSTYTPDAWVVVEINSEEFGMIKKIFAGWYGGYCGSDSWKLR